MSSWLLLLLLRSHTREGRSSAILTEIESVPQVVVTAEVHSSESHREMLGHLAARPETKTISETGIVSVQSLQTTPPSLAAVPAGGAVRPSVFTDTGHGKHIWYSGYPLPDRPETVIEGLSTHHIDPKPHPFPMTHTNHDYPSNQPCIISTTRNPIISLG